MFASLNRGWEVVGIRDGFNGMLLPENYPRGGVTRLDRGSVRGISHLGGTILGLSNKGTPTRTSGAAARLFATATSRGRVIVVEVMGRYAGWIALHAGMVPGAHCILIPEIPYELELVAAAVEKREERGAQFSIVVVAEGAVPLGGGSVSVKGKSIGQAEQLVEWVRPSPPDCDAILTAQDLGINFGDWMSDAFPT